MTNKQYILKALNWCEQKYGQVVMDTAIAWINLHFKGEHIMVDVLTRSPLFWKWWKNQWEQRDNRFVEVTAIDLLDYPINNELFEVINEEYCNLHDIYGLIIKPNKMVTKDCMRIIREEIEKEELIIKQNDRQRN